MMRFVVLLEKGKYSREIVGPYRTFKQAEGDAKAWDGIDGKAACVVELQKPDDFLSATKEPGHGS